jgi:hypothetical protein
VSIGATQTAAITNATTTQPAHPDPTASGLLLNVMAISFLLCSRCGAQAAESVWVL